MKVNFETDEDGNVRISGFEVVDPGELDLLGVDVVDRRDGKEKRIGTVESAEYRDGGIYATFRLDETPDE